MGLNEEIKQELRDLCGTVLFDEPMSRYTSIRIGGSVDALAYPRTIDELTSLLALARKIRLPVIPMGAGSNLLVRDKGIRAIVISLSQGFNALKRESGNVVFAEAGVGVPRLVDFTADEALSGLEALAGIPGNVGGALVMNAGTRDGEIGDRVVGVTFMDRDGRLMTWPREKIEFGYRRSNFPKGAVILSARFQLGEGKAQEVREKIKRDRERRQVTQPLNVPSLGSVFKNPKLGFAGAAIEEAGLKNIRIGGARISDKHANFIVNEGKATAKDVLALIGLIKDKVKEKCGIELELEAKVVGEE